MRLLNKTLLIGITSFVLTAAPGAHADKKDGLIATVNGKKITASMLADYQRSRGHLQNISDKQQTEMLIEELINRELILQDAIKNGVDKSPAVKTQMELVRKNVIAGTMLKNITEASKITDDDLRKEYDKRKNELVTHEFKASHILVEKEDTAKEIIKELDKGAKFADLAKKKSTGPSANSGGDLGWFKAGEMDKAFSDAVASLKDGQYTKSPVKTQFGWHVIARQGSREIPPPSFEQLKPQIRIHMQNLQIQQYIASLRKKAKIKRTSVAK